MLDGFKGNEDCQNGYRIEGDLGNGIVSNTQKSGEKERVRKGWEGIEQPMLRAKPSVAQRVRGHPGQESGGRYSEQNSPWLCHSQSSCNGWCRDLFALKIVLSNSHAGK